MGFEQIILISGVCVVAFSVGAIGFADALIAGAFWLHGLDPMDAVPLIIVTGMVMHLISNWPLREGVSLARSKPFVFGGFFWCSIGGADVDDD